jgi:hypothetical protein
MAHYRGVLQGSRGSTSRLGTKSSGLYAILSGWDVGVQVTIQHEDGKDVIYVRKTGGSNNTPENTSNLYNLDELIAGAK